MRTSPPGESLALPFDCAWVNRVAELQNCRTDIISRIAGNIHPSQQLEDLKCAMGMRQKPCPLSRYARREREVCSRCMLD